MYCPRTLLSSVVNRESRTENVVKVFLRYVDEILRTFKGDLGVVLEAVNKLHSNLQFTIEKLDRNGNLAFFDLNVSQGGLRKKVMWLVPKTH